MSIDFVFGDYRILYELNQEKFFILVIKANSRGQIYKSL